MIVDIPAFCYTAQWQAFSDPVRSPFVWTHLPGCPLLNPLVRPTCRIAVLHSGRSQDQREAAIKGFRDDTYNILIATDVAGRGERARRVGQGEAGWEAQGGGRGGWGRTQRKTLVP